MLSALLYVATDADRDRRSLAGLTAVLSEHGASLRQVDGGYYSGHWSDPHTRAYCDIDAGRAPLASPGPRSSHHDDPHNQGKEYPGWLPTEVVFNIPLSGPHWYAAEIGRWLDTILGALPGHGILLSEDIGIEGEPGYGPGPLDRSRLLACWEACHAEQSQHLTLPRMARRSSLALWRYRRLLAEAGRIDAHMSWPQGLVLEHDERALSTVLWSNPESPWVLPPVDLVVVERPGQPGLLPADEILTAAHGGQPLADGAVVCIEASAAVQRLFAEAHLLAPQAYRALSDHDWSD